MLGITAPYISEIESGKKSPSEQLLISVCKIFNVKTEWLKTGKGEIYETAYTYSSDNPKVQAIIRQLLSTEHLLSLGDYAMLFGIDRLDPDKRLDLPEEYWKLISWINKLFYSKDERRIRALLATMEALRLTDEEIREKVQEEFKKGKKSNQGDK